MGQDYAPNILNGTMSIVGPRPAAVDQVDITRGGENAIAATVPCGLTSQSSLWDYIYGDQFPDEKEYNEKVLPIRLKLDVYYVKNASFFGDIKLIVWTPLRTSHIFRHQRHRADTEAKARAFRPSDAELEGDTDAATNYVGVGKKYDATFPNIEMNTVPHLKLVQFIESAIRESEPDIVITHHPADTNNDHLQTSMACQEAIRLFQRQPTVKPVKEFWYMEVPSCSEWAINDAMNLFRPNCYVEVGQDGVEAKCKALSRYRGVMRPYPHPRSVEYITGLAAMRGSQWGCKYAEAFQVVLRRY